MSSKKTKLLVVVLVVVALGTTFVVRGGGGGSEEPPSTTAAASPEEAAEAAGGMGEKAGALIDEVTVVTSTTTTTIPVDDDGEVIEPEPTISVADLQATCERIPLLELTLGSFGDDLSRRELRTMQEGVDSISAELDELEAGAAEDADLLAAVDGCRADLADLAARLP